MQSLFIENIKNSHQCYYYLQKSSKNNIIQNATKRTFFIAKILASSKKAQINLKICSRETGKWTQVLQKRQLAQALEKMINYEDADQMGTLKSYCIRNYGNEIVWTIKIIYDETIVKKTEVYDDLLRTLLNVNWNNVIKKDGVLAIIRVLEDLCML